MPCSLSKSGYAAQNRVWGQGHKPNRIEALSGRKALPHLGLRVVANGGHVGSWISDNKGMAMRLEAQKKAAIESPSDAKVRRAIMSLRSYGPSSYASLTDDNGSYIQVGGGGVSCLVEEFDAVKGIRHRAYHGTQNAAFPDGTILVFSAGKIPMKSDEWFRSDQVADIFVAYLNRLPEPGYLKWRDAPGF